jgi:hypothetical protein
MLELFPAQQQNPAWQVFAYDGRGRALGKPVHIRAITRLRAESASKTLFRLFGIKGRFYPKAYLYDPTTDIDMRGFIRKI